jgi:predicted ATP-dependent endonuclease of OLD family
LKLKSFQIKSFRSIVDSTPVGVEGDATCLVGKNESGKTAILHALNRLNPVQSEPFDLNAEYPRWLISKDKREGRTVEAVPIEATFELDPEDLQAVQDAVGADVLQGTDLDLERRYDNVLRMSFKVDELKAVINFLEDANVSGETILRLGTIKTLEDLAPAITGARSNISADDKDAETVTKDLEQLEAKAAKDGAKGGTAWKVVADVLRDRIPRFFYFSEYQQLKGRIDLSGLANTGEERPGTSSDQTARALLALAMTSPAELSGDAYELRKAALEAVSNELSDQVFEYWTQNPNLRVRIDVDRVVENVGTPSAMAHSYLEVRVEDTRHKFTNNFSQRSSGFQWFFSFFAAFSEFENESSNVIVLLDEPGLSLHGRAQADFLRFINERLAPNAQVIYTTHSPFMVETDRMDRVRIVEDKGPKLGSVVSADALGVGDDSLFPLQAALGYDIAQHLFIGDTNLLVEGPSDFLYLDTISRYLESLGRKSLNERWRILPAGGSSNIPAFITLLGRNLNVTVLVDSGTEGVGRLQNAMEAGRLKSDRLISVGEITGCRHADIEDLFTESDYLELFNVAFGTKLKSGQLKQGGDRIVQRIEQTHKKFDHYKPAEVLLREQTTLLPILAEATLDNFEQLIVRINSTL